jgi:hypothetical protein
MEETQIYMPTLRQGFAMKPTGEHVKEAFLSFVLSELLSCLFVLLQPAAGQCCGLRRNSADSGDRSNWWTGAPLLEVSMLLGITFRSSN